MRSKMYKYKEKHMFFYHDTGTGAHTGCEISALGVFQSLAGLKEPDINLRWQVEVDDL